MQKRNQKLFTTILHLLISTSLIAQRQHISIDNNWKFAFGNAANPEKDFNYSKYTIFSKSGEAWGTAIEQKFNDSSWRTLNLPHDWAVELPFEYVNSFDVESHGYKQVGGYFPATSIGWYRKYFKVAASDSGQRFQIQFDGIFRDANIWINGFYLGNNKSGYVGCSYDITDFINFDKENIIVVRVDATQYEGWFYEGAGIYRHAWLNKYANIHIASDGIYAYSKIENNKATLSVETTIENETNATSNYTVKTMLLDRNGNVVAQTKEQNISSNIGEEKIVKQTINLTNPILWNLENPYLYRVVADVYQNGKLIDTKKIKFGFRTIDIKPNGVFVNGKYTKIHGTNNHQDHAGVGSAQPDYLHYYRVALLESMGVNAYRTSHNAPTPGLLDACDSLGMLVLDENRLLNSGPEYMSQFERLLKRDRSRACVFIWSIGNEEGSIQTNSFGKRIAQTFIAKQKLLDPSRTCTYAADVANEFYGVNEVIPVRSFNYRQYAVEEYHKAHPTQPILGTEMGSTISTRGIVENDSIRAYMQDEDVYAPWWSSTAEAWWKLAAPNDYWLGAFVWTGFDYRGEPTPYSWPNINSHFGIMDMCGFPKNIYYYYQSWWTDKDVLHISPHWNHEVEWNNPGKPIDVWVNSNADNVELFLNGKSLGKKDMPRNGHLMWTVNYVPGKLEAIAYKKGKRLYEKIETTGQATEVVMTPYKTTMLADGTDVTIINLSTIDKEGREVPTADNMIKFYLQGPGKIIGVGNGNPSSHEPDKCVDGAWQRSLFSGKCQIIVQSTHQSGIIHFQAKAAGLYTGSTDIVTVPPANISSINIDKKYELTGEATKPQGATKMLGADISFLPELEASGKKFIDNGKEKDAIEILKNHGLNYVRLRIFNEPANDSGYSPKKGFCDLVHTLQMAKRVKAAGLKLLLDFHYSDYWADPGKQYKPLAWENLSFTDLKKALYNYTKKVMEALQAQGTAPDMVQVGNEINHGLVWPDGNIMNVDNMAQLIAAGIAAVKTVEPKTIIMLHVALGGQNDEAVFFMDQMMARKIHFDVIGLSYYPKWHGTLENLNDNMNDLIRRYNKDVIVVEYAAKKEEVNKINFELPNNKGKGTCIWEPLSTWEPFFDKEGKANNYLWMYDELSKKYILSK